MGHRHDTPRASGDPVMPDAAAAQAPPDETSGERTMESKTTAAGVTGAAAAVLLWAVNEFTTVDMDAAVAMSIVVVVAWAGSYLMPSKTSVTSSGFAPTSIPFDPVLRQRIKAEVTAHPDGPKAPRDKRNELGHGSAPYVVWVLVGVILLIVLLRILGVL